MPSRRRLSALAVASVFAVAAFLTQVANAPARAQDATTAQMQKIACSLPHEQLLRTWRGWRPDRGAQISFIPKEPNYVGSGYPHVGPWEYIQHVPMLWYGPGYFKAQGDVARPVTSAGIAPTAAEVMKFDGFHAPDGQPMTEALLPADQRKVPKVFVTLVWDAGGMNVLQTHPNDWPFLRSLIPKGTFYSNATVGSSPTSTAQIHATIGTGAYPDNHGLVGHHLEVGGKLTTPWNEGPGFLVEPTFADIYDRALGNKPKVGIVGTVDIHFGMLGHGSFFNGGDRDIALTRSVIGGGDTLTDEGFEWNLPERDAPYFKLPDYANDVPGFEQDVRRLDQADGKLDGRWRDNPIEPLLKGFDTPARVPYQERVIETVMKREGFGKGGAPDLMYLNIKQIDYVSHVWTMNSPEMSDSVKAQDDALKSLVSFLNSDVGKGNWALLVTADHAAMPDPQVSGGFEIATGPLQTLIEQKFDTDNDGTPVVMLMQPTQVFIDTAELKDNGYTLNDVAAYMMTFTQTMTTSGGILPNPGQENDTIFSAAFPSALMTDLPCLPEAQG